jgi:hypothetical protein
MPDLRKGVRWRGQMGIWKVPELRNSHVIDRPQQNKRLQLTAR